VNPNTLSL